MLAAAPGIPPRQADRPVAPPAERTAGRRIRRQQHLSVHHQPRGACSSRGSRRRSPSWAARRRIRREPARPVSGKGAERERQVIEEDARDAQAFVDRWRPAGRGDDQRAPREGCCASFSARRSSRSASSSRRWPAAPICWDAAASSSARRAARFSPHGGSNNERVFRVIGGAGTAAVALGSNLGDRRAHLDYAVSASDVADGLCASPAYRETESGRRVGRPLFLNGRRVAATVGARPPRRLLEIEAERGRERRPFPGAADARSRSGAVWRSGPERAGARGPASAIPRAAIRAGAAGGDRAGHRGPGDRKDGGGTTGPASPRHPAPEALTPRPRCSSLGGPSTALASARDATAGLHSRRSSKYE